jgi:hypothetical protein
MEYRLSRGVPASSGRAGTVEDHVRERRVPGGKRSRLRDEVEVDGPNEGLSSSRRRNMLYNRGELISTRYSSTVASATTSHIFSE